ncbi:HPr kinase/phosphorylase [Ferrovibrio sp.]|uniref:HPr kinase/phosphorylase n=1 Tax=Ferrovibrio sp. TaxID=1917215 RepID=UPI00263323E7|nr:HPr kinase/phosphatase C-terminal domain-containing protein [Ferrovibrio sp.]
MIRLHASCVAIAGEAVLLRGPSGAGKSDLALRLIEAGARLVADDQTMLTRKHGRLVAAAPETIHGLIEIRGLGPVAMIPAPPTPVALLIDLVAFTDVPRLPEPYFETLLDIALPVLRLDAFTASAAIKVKWALARAAAGRLFEPAEAHVADPEKTRQNR